MESPFGRFTDREVLDILRDAGLPEDLTDENCARVGLQRIPGETQKGAIIRLWRTLRSVDAIFDALSGAVPKSSIRAHLSRATDAGLITRDWAVRRRRSRRRA